MELTQNKLAREQSKIVITKAKSLPHGQFEAVLSTDDLDRHGEHVSIKGLVVPKDQTIKMYYNHETSGANLPIGKWSKIWKSTDGKLMGQGEIDLNDPFAVMVYNKVQNGFIDSISIGFYPQEFDGETSTWTKSTLVEASVVAEPANVNARITSKDLGFNQDDFNKALTVKLAQTEEEDPNDLFTGTPGKPGETAPVEEPTKPETPPTEEVTSEDGAGEVTELKAAYEALKSKVDALEAAVKATDEGSATTKQLIQVRLAGKQVDKTANELNAVLRIKLKGTN